MTKDVLCADITNLYLLFISAIVSQSVPLTTWKSINDSSTMVTGLELAAVSVQSDSHDDGHGNMLRHKGTKAGSQLKVYGRGATWPLQDSIICSIQKYQHWSKLFSTTFTLAFRLMHRRSHTLPFLGHSAWTYNIQHHHRVSINVGREVYTIKTKHIKLNSKASHWGRLNLKVISMYLELCNLVSTSSMTSIIYWASIATDKETALTMYSSHILNIAYRSKLLSRSDLRSVLRQESAKRAELEGQYILYIIRWSQRSKHC